MTRRYENCDSCGELVAICNMRELIARELRDWLMLMYGTQYWHLQVTSLLWDLSWWLNLSCLLAVYRLFTLHGGSDLAISVIRCLATDITIIMRDQETLDVCVNTHVCSHKWSMLSVCCPGALLCWHKEGPKKLIIPNGNPWSPP